MSSSPIHYPESSESQLNSQRFSQAAPISQRIDNGLSQADQGLSSDSLISLQQNLPEAHIWGTDINVSTCANHFELFLNEFCNPGDETPKYHLVLEDIEETQVYKLDLDCQNLKTFDSPLYRQLISYPQEVLPIFEAATNKMYRKIFPEDPSKSQIQVVPFNLQERKKMRDIDPDDIDGLIAFTAMITRVSAVVPDIKVGFFHCSRCQHETEVEVDRGRINHPNVCENKACKSRDSYSLVHNRCRFADKQLVRVQETPEAIPEGETPQTVEVFAYSGLIDAVKPGDRVIITGVYRATSVRVSRTRRNTKAIYRSYLDAVHFRIVSASSEGGEDTKETTDEREARLRSLAEDPEIYEKLVRSVAPSIWEMEDVKKGLLCQLFGGVEKSRKGSKLRSEINVLLCGDPGTSKSQLLQYIHRISPRGIYTSGKGSSAVGLTASMSRDPETKEAVLESGALVLSDRGICCIDEFDKMSDSARSILHEVMEQQTISVAKAGVICSLNARTSVLAAANPRESRYDASKAVTENIMLPPTLLSRFDLIYLVMDRPNERLDRRLARHLVGLYGLKKEESRGDFLDPITLTHYISLARNEARPILTDEAATRLVSSYLELRKTGRYGGKKVIAATPRQLESLVRLSEALAKMRLAEAVTRGDVDEALRLMRVATQSAATDPKTGVINMDLISVGQNAMERREAKENEDLLLDLLEDGAAPVRLSLLRERFGGKSGKTMSSWRFEELVRSLQERQVLSCRNWAESDPMIQRVEI